METDRFTDINADTVLPAAGAVSAGYRDNDDVPAFNSEITADAKRQGISFGRFGILLPPAMIYEVVEHVRLTPLPGLANVFKGIVNHRGNIVPTYDLYELVQAKPGVWERNRIIICNKGRDAIAFVLYGLPMQLYPDAETQLDDAYGIPRIIAEHSVSIYRIDGVSWMDVNADSLFAAIRDVCLFEKRDDIFA